MEGCFTFQWGGCFSDGGASFLSGGAPHGGASVLMGGRGVSKKIVGCGGTPPTPPHAPPSPPLRETLLVVSVNQNPRNFSFKIHRKNQYM